MNIDFSIVKHFADKFEQKRYVGTIKALEYLYNDMIMFNGIDVLKRTYKDSIESFFNINNESDAMVEQMRQLEQQLIDDLEINIESPDDMYTQDLRNNLFNVQCWFSNHNIESALKQSNAEDYDNPEISDILYKIKVLEKKIKKL